MSRTYSLLLLFCLLCTCVRAQQDYPITPVSFSEVKIQDEFWAPKIRINHEVTIPIAIQKSRETGRIDNFRIAGHEIEGQFCSEYPFDDSDIYKIIEAASYSLQTFPDPALELEVDSLITFIGEAQEPDGYLYTTRTIGKNIHPWAGTKRWELVHELSHELYNLGHLYEAAVAHYRATGKRSLLDIAVKSADLVDDTFGPGKLRDYPGHQEVEIGLVKLYRVTGEQRYLDLAKFFLDVRGQPGVGNPKEYDQSHLPVTEQSAAVGHAVRGAYMWTAMADIAAITGDSAYRHAIERIWHDIADSKYYLNGGIGATGSGEAFGDAYELPNMSAYAETCAGVGMVRWNHRMFLMSGDSKYIDVLERTLYNNVLDGVSLSGDHFFYPNPPGQHGTARTARVVRLRLLPAQRGPHPALDAGVHLRPPRRGGLRQYVRFQRNRLRGERHQPAPHPAEWLPLGGQRAAATRSRHPAAGPPQVAGAGLRPQFPRPGGAVPLRRPGNTRLHRHRERRHRTGVR